MSALNDVRTDKAKLSERLIGWPEEDLGTNESGHASDEADALIPQVYYGAWIGQRFLEGKYVIVRKLGYGQHASVWLARDRSYVSTAFHRIHR